MNKNQTCGVSALKDNLLRICVVIVVCVLMPIGHATNSAIYDVTYKVREGKWQSAGHAVQRCLFGDYFFTGDVEDDGTVLLAPKEQVEELGGEASLADTKFHQILMETTINVPIPGFDRLSSDVREYPYIYSESVYWNGKNTVIDVSLGCQRLKVTTHASADSAMEDNQEASLELKHSCQFFYLEKSGTSGFVINQKKKVDVSGLIEKFSGGCIEHFPLGRQKSVLLSGGDAVLSTMSVVFTENASVLACKAHDSTANRELVLEREGDLENETIPTQCRVVKYSQNGHILTFWSACSDHTYFSTGQTIEFEIECNGSRLHYQLRVCEKDEFQRRRERTLSQSQDSESLRKLVRRRSSKKLMSSQSGYFQQNPTGFNFFGMETN